MKKRVFSTEAAYAVGLIALALGTALTEKAGFGMSMIVAPAYLIYLKISQALPFFSFGMAEYLFQALLLISLSLLFKKVKRKYLFSFVTTVIYGAVLDLSMFSVGLIPLSGMVWRVVFFCIGCAVCAVGVALLFRTYLPPEAYELFVKEISIHYGKAMNKVKLVYDCASCILAIALSFAFFGFGKFIGVSWGTVVCALINGPLIGLFGGVFERSFIFRDVLPWRSFFEK